MIETCLSSFANGWTHYLERGLEDLLAHHFISLIGCWANPWAVMGLSSGKQVSAFFPRNPDVCQILSTDQHVPVACPFAPETRADEKLWIKMATECSAGTSFWNPAGKRTRIRNRIQTRGGKRHPIRCHAGQAW